VSSRIPQSLREAGCISTMSSYDWSALRSALSSSSITRAPRIPNNRAIKEFLSQWGISEEIAAPVSKNELCYWHTSEVQEVFAKLDTTPAAIKTGLQSFDNDASSATKPIATLPDADLLKPDVGLMVQSVEKRAALCVNESGTFSLRDTDYVAMSHVWIEGVGADLDNQGLPRRLIQHIFSRIRPIGVEWIWLDSLAIPGGVEALSLHEEDLKASLINCLADIYRKAKAVVILDALVLRLRSTDPVETAVVLCCGCKSTTRNCGVSNGD
jgi:hypothetical protein